LTYEETVEYITGNYDSSRLDTWLGQFGSTIQFQEPDDYEYADMGAGVDFVIDTIDGRPVSNNMMKFVNNYNGRISYDVSTDSLYIDGQLLDLNNPNYQLLTKTFDRHSDNMGKGWLDTWFNLTNTNFTIIMPDMSKYEITSPDSSILTPMHILAAYREWAISKSYPVSTENLKMGIYDEMIMIM